MGLNDMNNVFIREIWMEISGIMEAVSLFLSPSTTLKKNTLSISLLFFPFHTSSFFFIFFIFLPPSSSLLPPPFSPSSSPIG